MKLLLDTHMFLWWYLDQSQLPSKYADILTTVENRREPIALSIATLWEIAKLVQIGKFEINFSLDQWFQEIEEDMGLRVLPISARIILDSVRLGTNFPKDPMDQLIAATARCHELRLLTVDDKIIKSGVVSIA